MLVPSDGVTLSFQLLTSLSLPVHHHTCLREREGKKSPDGKERDQAIGNAAKDDQ